MFYHAIQIGPEPNIIDTVHRLKTFQVLFLIQSNYAYNLLLSSMAYIRLTIIKMNHFFAKTSESKNVSIFVEMKLFSYPRSQELNKV